MANRGKWIDTMWDMTGKYVQLETFDGVLREGKLSTLITRSLDLNGRTVNLPTGVELNGDTYDVVPFERIKMMKVVG